MDYLDKLIALRTDNDLSQKEVGKIIDKSRCFRYPINIEKQTQFC